MRGIYRYSQNIDHMCYNVLVSERKILSEIFPAHADLQPVLKRIRTKYGLPDLGSLDKNLSNILLIEEDIPWNEIQAEIKAEIESDSEFFPEAIQPVRRLLKTNPNALKDPKQFSKELVITPEDIQAASATILTMLKPLAQAYTQMVDDLSRLLFVYLATGETEDIPLDWLGAVYTTSIFGEPVVVAMAGQLSNPKEIVEQFTAEIHRTFGKKRPIITDEFRNTAKYLRKRFEGISLNKLADEYIQDHPSEFTKDRKSPDFRDQRYRLIDRLKKSLKRYDRKLMELVGDKSKP